MAPCQLRTWKKEINLKNPEYFLVVRVYSHVSDDEIYCTQWADLVTSAGVRSAPASVLSAYSEEIVNFSKEN